MDRAFEIVRRVEIEQFRRRHASLAEQLPGLLPHSTTVVLLNRDQARARVEAWSASRVRRGRAPSQWFFGSATGPDDGTSVIAAGFAAMARAIRQPVWLLLDGLQVQCVEASSEDVLMQWQEIAALADHDLKLHDAAADAGVWLTCHSHHWSGAITYTWELEVWNDPWEGAARAAFGEAHGSAAPAG